jgi:hypothetical protein
MIRLLCKPPKKSMPIAYDMQHHPKGVTVQVIIVA